MAHNLFLSGSLIQSAALLLEKLCRSHHFPEENLVFKLKTIIVERNLEQNLAVLSKPEVPLT